MFELFETVEEKDKQAAISRVQERAVLEPKWLEPKWLRLFADQKTHRKSVFSPKPPKI